MTGTDNIKCKYDLERRYRAVLGGVDCMVISVGDGWLGAPEKTGGFTKSEEVRSRVELISEICLDKTARVARIFRDDE